MVDSEVEMAILNQLLARLRSRTSRLKVAILNTLEELGQWCQHCISSFELLCSYSLVNEWVSECTVGVGGREVVSNVLPLLVDSDVSL